MPITPTEENDGRTMIVRVSGKLVKADYDQFVPKFDCLVSLNKKPSVLFDMADFHGWTASALWEDTKFAFHHFRSFERLAIVGEKKWQEGMSEFCVHFTKAEVKWFDRNHYAEARTWLQKTAITV